MVGVVMHHTPFPQTTHDWSACLRRAVASCHSASGSDAPLLFPTDIRASVENTRAPPEGPALYRNLRNAIIAPDGFFPWKCHFET